MAFMAPQNVRFESELPRGRACTSWSSCDVEEPSRGRALTWSTGDCSQQRYLSPESAYFDPPAWTSLGDAHVLGLPAFQETPSVTILTPLPIGGKQDVERDTSVSTEEPREPVTPSETSRKYSRQDSRKWSEMSEDCEDECPKNLFRDMLLPVSGMEKVDADGQVIPRRWMRGKRGGVKHRSKAKEAKAKAEEEAEPTEQL